MHNLYLFYVIHHLLKHSHLLGHHLLLSLYQISKQYFGFVSVQALLYNSPYPQKQPPQVFCKKAILTNFAKFLGKHRAPPATLLKKRLWHRCFSVNFAKFLRTPFSQNTSRQLLLYPFLIFYSKILKCLSLIVLLFSPFSHQLMSVSSLSHSFHCNFPYFQG